MSGHSKWSQIKHKKAATDAKKSRAFSKILGAIAIAARQGGGPGSNPHLRTLIEKAHAGEVPKENIERALRKPAESDALQEITIEAYGPEKAALIIEAITDNTNRTIHEIRNILEEHGAKPGGQGSVCWLFERASPGNPWIPKFKKTVSEGGCVLLTPLLEALQDHPDVERVATDIEQPR